MIKLISKIVLHKKKEYNVGILKKNNLSNLKLLEINY